MTLVENGGDRAELRPEWQKANRAKSQGKNLQADRTVSSGDSKRIALACPWEWEVNEWTAEKTERGGSGELGDVKGLEALIKKLSWLRVESYSEWNGTPSWALSRKSNELISPLASLSVNCPWRLKGKIWTREEVTTVMPGDMMEVAGRSCFRIYLRQSPQNLLIR